MSEAASPVTSLKDVTHRYGETHAIVDLTLDIPAGVMAGMISPDGTGKSTLLGIISGSVRVQQGAIEVLGGDIATSSHRQRVCVRIAYMPQGLGKNLYPTGVDPIARDHIWELMLDLSRKDGVTIFISTHFMNEAEHCDRILLMHGGRVLSAGVPAELVKQSGAETLEAMFIAKLEKAQTEASDG